jgi:hypothetical protein
MRVAVMGWNSIEDVRSAPQRTTGPTNGRKVNNLQVDETAMRSLGDLPN